MTLIESKAAAEKDFAVLLATPFNTKGVYRAGHTMAQAAAEIAFVKGYIHALPFLDENDEKVSSFLKKYFGRCNVFSVAIQYENRDLHLVNKIADIVCMHIETRLVDAVLYTTKGFKDEFVFHCLFAVEKTLEMH